MGVTDTAKSIRVLVVDDQPSVRAAIRAVLRCHNEFEIVGEAADRRAALRLINEVHPHVVLLDAKMPTVDGLDIAAQITKENPGVRVLLMLPCADEFRVRQATQVGAAGILVKDAVDRLDTALREVAAGRTYFSPFVSRLQPPAQGSKHHGTVPPERLSPRQRQVVRLIAEGCSTKQIADKLGIGVKTAQTHRSQLMKRLDLHDVAGVVRYALRVGLATVGN